MVDQTKDSKRLANMLNRQKHAPLPRADDWQKTDVKELWFAGAHSVRPLLIISSHGILSHFVRMLEEVRVFVPTGRVSLILLQAISEMMLSMMFRESRFAGWLKRCTNVSAYGLSEHRADVGINSFGRRHPLRCRDFEELQHPASSAQSTRLTH